MGLCLAVWCGTVQAQFVAYNDHIRGSGTSSNATSYYFTGTNTGPLLNISNGAATPVALTLTNMGVSFAGTSAAPNAGSPAALLFGGFVTFGNGLPLVPSNGVLAHVLTGLNPARRYRIQGAAVRGGASYTGRWALFELAQARSFENAHTAGCYTNGSGGLALGSNQVALWTGDNRVGDVFGWTNVAPGPEGVLVVYTRRLMAIPTGYSFDTAVAYAYGLEALRVEESFAPAPAVTAEPVDVVAALGDPFSLAVTARGAEPLAYQWRRGPSSTGLTLLPGATNATWLVASASAQDLGYYDVVVSNPSGSATSRVVSVQITTEPPVILSQPADLTVFYGAPVSFSVSVTGANPSSFQWDKDGVPLAGATGTSYSIPSAGLEHAGVYGFSASNGLGAVASSNAVLSVVDAPAVLTLQPQDQASVEGGAVNLSAAATGTRLGYQWFRGGEPLAGAANAVLILTNLMVSDSGYYQLCVSNSANTVWSRSALVAVAPRPVSLFGTNQVWAYNDTGAILATNWTAPVYPQAESWPRGPGLLGFKTDGSGTDLASDTSVPAPFQTFRTRLSRTGTNGVTNSTYYLRTGFVVNSNDLRHSPSVVFSSLIDDGAVLYLNGAQVFRYGMAAGAGPGDWAASSTNASAWVRVTLPASLLRPGSNVAAVELHQVNVTSTDVDYLGILGLETPPPAPLVALRYPASTNVPEGAPAALSVEIEDATNAWAEYQWYKLVDGLPQALPGATGPVLAFSHPIGGVDDGAYFVTVSNVLTQLVSPLARLTVIPAGVRPALVLADGSPSATRVLLTFSVAIDPATTANPAQYTLQSALGGAADVLAAVMTSPSNVLLTTSARQAGVNWLVSIRGVRDTSVAGNFIVPGSTLPVGTLVPLVGPDVEWTFANPVPGINPPDPGEGWRLPGFVPNPADWAVGHAPFGFWGVAPGAMPGSINTRLSRGVTLACFRTGFHFPGSPAGARLLAEIQAGDGVAVFLNGAEAARANLSAGVLSATNRAVATNIPPVSVALNSSAASLLVAGSNLLAVQLHNSSATLGNMYLNARLSAWVESLVTGPVRIVSGPESQAVAEGENALFSIRAAGAAQFQWFRNGAAIAGATNDSLRLENVPVSFDGSQLSVVAWTGDDQAASSNATLRIVAGTSAPALVSAYAHKTSQVIPMPPPPPFEARTLGADSGPGGSVVLRGSVNPSGYAPVRVWFEWGPAGGAMQQSEACRDLTGTESRPVSLTLSNLASGAAYQYRLTGSNCLGVAAGERMTFNTAP